MKKRSLDTVRATSRTVQRAMFLDNLREQLDKMAVSCRKDELVKSAREYVSDGCSEVEVEELLVIDGFDRDMVKACVTGLFLEASESPSSSMQWGFDVEDSYGRITSHADLGIEITASTEQEATDKVSDIVSKSDDDASERVISVYPLNQD